MILAIEMGDAVMNWRKVCVSGGFLRTYLLCVCIHYRSGNECLEWLPTSTVGSSAVNKD